MEGSRLGLFTALALVACLAVPAYSGTIRNDRSDSLYTGLATKYVSVGRVDGTTSSSGFLASGTLIDSQWVLTAAHVVNDAASLTFTIGGTPYSADYWVANSNFNIDDLGAGYDIGLIHLGSAVTGVTPATRYMGSAELGTVGTSVGYGMTGTGLTGYRTNWRTIKKRAGQNTLDAFYSASTPNVILMDFDRPGKKAGTGVPAESSYGSAVPLNLEYLIAPGDSGGGLFADFTVEGVTTTQLIGVHSFGWGRLDGNPNSDYGDVSGDTRVSVFKAWIDVAMSGWPVVNAGSNATGATDFVLGDYEYFSLDGMATVPEPATMALLALGGVVLARRRRRQ